MVETDRSAARLARRIYNRGVDNACRRRWVAVGCVLISVLTTSWFEPMNTVLAQSDAVLFALDRREAAKGEAVVATFRLGRPAQQVRLVASTADGAPASFQLPQAVAWNALHDAGVVTFRVPMEAGTLSPIRVLLSVDGRLLGEQQLYVRCDHAWFFTPRVERCPFAPVRATPAAAQRFERGVMIWLQATNSIYVLYAAPASGAGDGERVQRMERFDDRNAESASEPAAPAASPEDRSFPARGFDLAWRSAVNVRRKLGRALEPARSYTACFGYAFGGGKSMRMYVTTPDDRLLEFDSYYAPHHWRELSEINGQPVTLTGCSR